MSIWYILSILSIYICCTVHTTHSSTLQTIDVTMQPQYLGGRPRSHDATCGFQQPRYGNIWGSQEGGSLTWGSGRGGFCSKWGHNQQQIV